MSAVPMPLNALIVHLLLAIVLFFVANWLGEYSITDGYHQMSLLESVDEAPAFNFVFRVVTPLVYIAIVAALLYRLDLDQYVKNIYVVVLDYFLIRWAYNWAVERATLLNWPLQIGTAALTIASAFLLDRQVISVRSTLLPDARSLNSNLWVLIVIYVYSVMNRVPFPHRGAARRRQAYIIRRYRRLYVAFGREVAAASQNSVEQALVYAVLVYETFNRSYLYRFIERRLLFPLGFAKTLGPMQVDTTKPWSDEICVEAGATKLLTAFRGSLPAAESSVARWCAASDKNRQAYVDLEAIRLAARSYNVRSDYAGEIESLHGVLARDVFNVDLPGGD